MNAHIRPWFHIIRSLAAKASASAQQMIAAVRIVDAGSWTHALLSGRVQQLTNHGCRFQRCSSAESSAGIGDGLGVGIRWRFDKPIFEVVVDPCGSAPPMEPFLAIAVQTVLDTGRSCSLNFRDQLSG
jgi:hypothetical protein